VRTDVPFSCADSVARLNPNRANALRLAVANKWVDPTHLRQRAANDNYTSFPQRPMTLRERCVLVGRLMTFSAKFVS